MKHDLEHMFHRTLRLIAARRHLEVAGMSTKSVSKEITKQAL